MSDTEKQLPEALTGNLSSSTSMSNAPPIIKVTALHPKVADSVSQMLSEARARKLSVDIHMGLRTAEQQDHLYALGRTLPGSIVTNAPGWSSWHNYGLAVDIVFKDEKGNWTWSDSCDWNGLGAVGKVFGFSWGGDWTRFPDMPHFQIIGKIPNVKEAKRILFEQGLDALWALV